VLKDLSLDVAQGAFLTILGPTGSGKTTLLKLLAGFLRAQRGTVELLGESTSGGVPLRLRQRVGYIPQQLGLVRGTTAMENVLTGTLGRRRGLGPFLGFFPREELEAAYEWLERLGIADKARERVFRLSGGERQRVAIARTLVQRPDIVLADELVSDLDLPRALEILYLLRDIGAGQGITFVLNMHELPLVQALGSAGVLLRDGRVVGEGKGRELTWAGLQEALR
jgi:phosphonate transport system ATP-binding protein